MELKQLPSKISDEELLKQLEENKEPLTEDYTGFDNDIALFISYFNLKSGTNDVPVSTLYDLYRRWSKTPVTANMFSVRLSGYFASYFPADDQYKNFKLDVEAINLKKEAWKYLDRRSTNKQRNPKLRKHFESFLNHYEIKPGTNFIESYVLFYLYDKWTYKNKSPININSKVFATICKFYFKTKRLSDSKLSFFGVNDTIKGLLTEEEILQLRNGRKWKNEKKANKKKSDSVSSSR